MGRIIFLQLAEFGPTGVKICLVQEGKLEGNVARFVRIRMSHDTFRSELRSRSNPYRTEHSTMHHGRVAGIGSNGSLHEIPTIRPRLRLLVKAEWR